MDFWEEDLPAEEFGEGEGGLDVGVGGGGLGDFCSPIADLTLPATI